MSVRNALNASTSPFAHLASTPRASEDDDQKKKDEEAKAAAAKKAEDDKKDDEAKKAKAEEDKKKDEEAKAKAKKAEEEGDDDMEDEEQDKDARAARARERSRIKAILVSEPGKANPVAAAHLATGTSMPRGQAIEMLAAMQAGMTPTASEPRRDDLRDRMAQVPNATVGAEVESPAPNLAAQIIAADAKRRGKA